MLRLAILLGLVTLGTGCSVYDASLLDAGGIDLGVDLGDAGMPVTGCDGGEGGTCLASPPPRPTSADGDGPEVVFALRHLVLNQNEDRWKAIGYDLDGLDTQPGHLVTECVPISGSALQVDGVAGTDNALGHTLAPLLLAAMPGLEATLQLSQDLGTGAVLLDVNGWNGLPDDPRVSVVFSQTVYGTPGLADGGVPDAALPDGGPIYTSDGGDPPLPRWDGNDYWWARDDSFFAGDPTRPRISDDNAYVAGSTLVMRLPDARDIIFSGNAQETIIRLSDAVLTVHLTAGGHDVDRAILAGRWSMNDILESVPRSGVCVGTTSYMLLTNLLQSTVDVRGVPGTGGTGVMCDAISVGFQFDGTRGRYGGLAPAVVPGDLCPDAGT